MDEDIDKIMKVVLVVLKVGNDFGKVFEIFVIFEKKVESEEMERLRVRGNVKILMLENGEL